MEFGEHLSSDKESECFGGRAQVYTRTPLFLVLSILWEYYYWIPMSFFTKDKVLGAWTVYFLKKGLKGQEEKISLASSYGLMA